MKKQSKSVVSRLVILLVMAAVLLAGCGKDTSAPAAGNGTYDPDAVLVLNISEPSILNPILSTDSESSAVAGFVFNGLMKADENLNMVPDLAASYNISTDGKTYTFYLRKGITFHDGHELTAEDVKFTFDKILDKKTNTVRRSSYEINGKPVRFKIIDQYTIQAILPEPFSPFLVNMSMEILPKHLLENEDINTAAFNRYPIGTGPFTFEEWQSGQYVRLKRYNSYFDGNVKLAGIIYKIIPDKRTALIALEKGELHATSIPNKDFERIEKDPRLNVFRYDQLMYSYLAFNLEHPLFKDVRVRQALAHAIDKEALVNAVLRGYGRPAHLPASPVAWSYPDDKDVYKIDYNPEKAKSLLRQAGYRYDASGKLLTASGQPVSFTVITNKGNVDREKSVQIIQRYMANIGIDMRIQLMEWGSFIKIVNSPKAPKDFDAVLLGWSTGIDPDSYSIWHSSQYPQGFNFIGYKNPRVDALLERGRQVSDRGERKKIYGEMYDLIARDLPYIFLYYPQSLQAVDKHVRGLSEPGPLGVFFDITEIHIVK